MTETALILISAAAALAAARAVSKAGARRDAPQDDRPYDSESHPEEYES